MEATQLQQLQESHRKLALRLAKTEAREATSAKLATIDMSPQAKQLVAERCVESAPITADGEFDGPAFDALLEREISYVGKLLGRPAAVIGMGNGTTQATEAQRAEREAEYERELSALGSAFGLQESGVKTFVKGRV